MKPITEESKSLSSAPGTLLTELSLLVDSTGSTDSAGEYPESKRESKQSEPESKTGVEGYPASEGVRFSTAQKLQAMRQAFLTDRFINQELAYYVPPHGQPMAESAQGQPLQPWIEQEFLTGDARVLLIQGPGGAGKSTFNRFLCRRLWQDPAWSSFQPGAIPPKVLAPLFIPLGSAEVEPRRLLQYLTHLPEPAQSFTETELNVLKSDYALLLIADGYDEIPQGCQLNLYDVNGLDRYAGRIKLLVSRRDAVEMSDQSFVPHTHRGQSEYRYYRIRYLSPFTEAQRSDYLSQYLAQNKDREDVLLWPKASDYLTQFKAIPGLDALIGTPFLLCIAAEVLPGIVAGVAQEGSLGASPEEKVQRTELIQLEPLEFQELPRFDLAQTDPDQPESEPTAPRRADKLNKELKYASNSNWEELEQEQEHKTLSVDPVSLEKKVESSLTLAAPTSHIIITRLRLYHQFMSQWFTRQAQKAAESKALLSDPFAFLGEEEIGLIQTVLGTEATEAELASAYLQQGYLRFCQQLALHLHAEQRVRIQYPREIKRGGLSSRVKEEEKTALLEVEAEWVKALFGSEESDWHRVRQGCPLRHSAANEHEFLHASLIDYFAATVELEQAAAETDAPGASSSDTAGLEEKRREQALSKPIASPLEETVTTVSSPSPSLPEVSAELPKRARRGLGAARGEGPSAMALRLPDEQPEFLGFLFDELKVKPNQAYYENKIEHSKTDFSQEAVCEASNAATVLNWSGANLVGRDWRGVRIPGADLRYGVLAEMNLSGADLRGATLTRAMLYQTDLRDAQLQDVRWGEQPSLRCKTGVSAIAYHPREPWLAVAEHTVITLRHGVTGEVLGELLRGNYTVGSVSFSPDGYLLASGSGDGAVRLWTVESRQSLGEPLTGHGHKGGMAHVSFSPDGRLLASGSSDGTVRLWRVESRQLLGEPLTGHTGGVESVSFSPDGRLLASGGGQNDSTVRLWTVESGQALGKPLTGHKCEVSSVSFSPDGRLLATGSMEKVRLWTVESRRALGAPLTGHNHTVNSVSFSPDGRLLASGSYDRTVRLWTVESRRCLRVLSWLDPVNAVTFAEGPLIRLLSQPPTELEKAAVRQGQVLLVIPQSLHHLCVGFLQ